MTRFAYRVVATPGWDDGVRLRVDPVGQRRRFPARTVAFIDESPAIAARDAVVELFLVEHAQITSARPVPTPRGALYAVEVVAMV